MLKKIALLLIFVSFCYVVFAKFTNFQPTFPRTELLATLISLGLEEGRE